MSFLSVPAQQRLVALERIARALGEAVDQLALGETLFLLAPHVQDDPALVHHDQTVAVADRVAHVVGDHQRGQMLLGHDAVRQLQHLRGGGGVERGGVLVEQQQLGPAQRGHQQRQRLALTAGEQPDLDGQTLLQPEPEIGQQRTLLS